MLASGELSRSLGPGLGGDGTTAPWEEVEAERDGKEKWMEVDSCGPAMSSLTSAWHRAVYPRIKASDFSQN